MKDDKYTNLTLGGDNWTPKFVTKIDQSRCSQCCFCVKICPANVFAKTVKGTVEAIRIINCYGCTSCERMCKEKAIKCIEINKHPKGKKND